MEGNWVVKIVNMKSAKSGSENEEEPKDLDSKCVSKTKRS